MPLLLLLWRFLVHSRNTFRDSAAAAAQKDHTYKTDRGLIRYLAGTVLKQVVATQKYFPGVFSDEKGRTDIAAPSLSRIVNFSYCFLRVKLTWNNLLLVPYFVSLFCADFSADFFFFLLAFPSLRPSFPSFLDKMGEALLRKVKVQQFVADGTFSLSNGLLKDGPPPAPLTPLFTLLLGGTFTEIVLDVLVSDTF